MDVDQFRKAMGIPVKHTDNVKARGHKRTKYGKRHQPGVMNETESLYAEILEQRRLAGEVIAWWFEDVTLKLAPDLRYTPDFKVLLADQSIEYVDTKGSGPIDPKSLVKIKAAAEKFHLYQFVIEQRQTKKNGGGWKRTEF
jgi:hypothetical protein